MGSLLTVPERSQVFGSSDLDDLLRGDRVGEQALRCRHASIQGKRGGMLADRIVLWIEERLKAAQVEADKGGVGAHTNTNGGAAVRSRARSRTPVVNGMPIES